MVVSEQSRWTCYYVEGGVISCGSLEWSFVAGMSDSEHWEGLTHLVSWDIGLIRRWELGGGRWGWGCEEGNSVYSLTIDAVFWPKRPHTTWGVKWSGLGFPIT